MLGVVLDAHELRAGGDEFADDVPARLAAAAHHDVIPEICDASLHASLLPMM